MPRKKDNVVALGQDPRIAALVQELLDVCYQHGGDRMPVASVIGSLELAKHEILTA